MKIRNCLVNLGILGASLAALLLVLEVALRLFSPSAGDLVAQIPADPAVFTPDRPDSPPIGTYHEYFGWGNTPGAAGEYRGPDGIRWRVEINSRGFRDRERPREKPAGVRRLVLLGDSFAWGYGLSAAERLSELLEASLPGTEVINLGLAGTSTDQQCLVLEREGLGYSPDGAILLVHDTDIWHNSLKANYGRPKPHFVLLGEKLELRGFPVPREQSPGAGEWPAAGEEARKSGLKSFFGAHSRLYRLLADRIKSFPPLRKVLQGAGAVDDSYDSAYNVELTGRIVTRMRDSARKAGAKDFLVILVPSKELVKFHSGSYLFPGADLARREEESAALARVLREAGIPVLDLGEEFVQLSRAGEELYFLSDNHWNARANAIAAERAAEVLRGLGYGKGPRADQEGR